MKLNKKCMMAVSAIVSVVMLSTGAFANYVNTSGYNDCKRALKNLLNERNYTMDIKCNMYVDDKNIAEAGFKQLLNLDSDVKMNQFQTEKSDSRSYVSQVYFQDGEKIYKTDYEVLNDEDYRRSPAEFYYTIDDENPNIGYLFETDEDDKKMVDNIVKFTELAADMIVGDLKNNMILVENDTAKNVYALNLESYQIPEIITSGLAVLGSAETNDYQNIQSVDEKTLQDMIESNPMLLVGEEPVIDSATANVVLGKDGKLYSAEGEFSLSGSDYLGNPHSFRFTLNIDISDYGTTQPQRIDYSGKFVQRQSRWREDRIEMINRLLESDTDIYSEEELEDLKEERDSLISYVEEKKAEAEKADTEVDETETVETEETTSFPAENSSSSIGVIGGSDGPTAVYVTKTN